MSVAAFGPRIERASELAQKYPGARELLRFYQILCEFHRDFHGQMAPAAKRRNHPAPGRLFHGQADWTFLLPEFRPFLRLVQAEAPEPLRKFTADLETRGTNAWLELLEEYWASRARASDIMDPMKRFCALAFLRPYAEFLAAQLALVHAHHRPVCPICGCKPVAGVLRPEGDGGKRLLLCGLCMTEWEYRRVVCARCEEEREEKLCVYEAREFEHVRIEACDTCHAFLKTVDMTKDGRAVPEPDELASIPLTLWAQEKGYTRIEPNLLGA
jgi:formate dehydrogenase accessory protein FdhE